nr:basement membrane-specific heparan sulfate proteoglycan core protein isoform X5 [Paramormyrops kingsleyae]
MGTLHRKSGRAAVLVALILLLDVAQSSKVWSEVAFPEDMEAERGGRQFKRFLAESDDEDFAMDEASGERPSGEEDGSTPGSNIDIQGATAPPWESPAIAEIHSPDHQEYIYYRALVNFTNSFVYGPELEDINSPLFKEITDAVVDTLESEYNKIPGSQTVNVIIIKKLGNNVFVELDVGSEVNMNTEQIRNVLFSVVKEGSIASYITSVHGFQFRRLGGGDLESSVDTPLLVSVEPISFPVQVDDNRQPCTDSEFTCRDGECIPSEYRCDKRHDCRDMSDESDCVLAGPRPPVLKPPVLRPCRADQATCQNGQCIPRDYLCDGERDCSDGSDELACGTPSPCEPNEFKCQNGHCALKLWRCDGDNDCGDNSDESYCPVKSPGDTCAPEQFVCVRDRTCIPASYQCDEEPDCPDRSDEIGCTPPTITSPPEESVMAMRGETVTFTCKAVGVPTPIITWRLNWGHIPNSSRISMASVNGHGTLTIQDVKDGDQGAYTCEAINAKGMVFGIPDGVLTVKPNTAGHCTGGHFGAGDGSACIPCFCFGITKNCQNTGRHRNQIRLRFTEEDNFKGVNVSFPSRPASPPLSSTQLLINTEVEEFQLVDLSRRFLSLESFWTLPSQFLGNKVDSYGGSLNYKVRFTLARGETEPVQKPDVVLVGNGQKLIYRRTSPTSPRITNEREIKFTEENWQHASGRLVTREDLMMTLVNLESINIRTTYDNRMVSVALRDIVMDTTTVEFSGQGPANDVEQCRCPPGYSGLSCESCASGFERVSGGSYLGSCAGCNCNGHASACDPISGHCLSCQHNTEGPQCNKCRPGYFGDPTRGRSDDCKPCPCPYIETSRRFSDTCFLDSDSQATCDACRPGYTGRRCEKCAPGYHGNPLQPNGKCVPQTQGQCDNRGTISSSSRPCRCKSNVVGALCDECRSSSFHLTEDNPDGCLQCFCMGVTKQCTSSTWSRDQVRGGVNGQLFSLANAAHTRTISDGIGQRGGSEVIFRFSTHVPHDVLFWVLPESFRGDKVTAYGGELRYTVSYVPRQHSAPIEGQPDVVLQGNGIMLEHYSSTKPTPHVATVITVPFRESEWKRSDRQPCTREHLLMALADITVFMIRATYANSMTETGIADIWMDIAVPHSTGNERALEVEECACPQGYRGPSCQECDVGYIRTGSGLYLGTCERCNCHGYATTCDPDTGNCLQCQHNTAGPHCDRCRPGYYGNPRSGSPAACQPCPCPGTSPDIQFSRTCFLDSDGQPTCDGCPPGFTGRRCERCAAGYSGNPQLGQACVIRNDLNGNCYSCDQRGSDGCDSNGVCRCKAYVEGPLCAQCKPGHFHLSPAHKDGCLSCFCMGITQQCSSSSYYRDLVSSSFAPGHFQGFALVNRQRTNRIATGFTVEVSTQGTQLSFSRFGNLAQEAHYWQLPEAYRGDKSEAFYARMRRAHKKDSLWTEEQMRKDASIWKLMDSMMKDSGRLKRAVEQSPNDIQQLDEEIWALISNFSHKPTSRRPFSLPASPASLKPWNSPLPSAQHAPTPLHQPSGLLASKPSRARGPHSTPPGYSSKLKDAQALPQTRRDVNVYALVYKGFSLYPEEVLFWQLPPQYKGVKVGSYGGRLKYTLSYVSDPRGSSIEDVDVQIIGNDITLVTRQPWPRGQGTRESRQFEVVFKEENWQRPDGMPATREHLMMVLADLDDILIRASYYTDMRSTSISDVSMEVAVPNYTGLTQALEVEECRCPPGYRGLSCQDCAAGYTRTGGGLYLGHCELCDCNGHSDSCHPETGVCTSCLHNTMGQMCEQCAAGFFGDPTAGTPEDCQPCACPHTDPENQFSHTCESTGNGGYQCTACQRGYTGQYCERCSPGYVGNPQERIKCHIHSDAVSLVVRIQPERVQVSQGGSVTLRCQVTSLPPHKFQWSREDGRSLSSNAEIHRHGEELHFSSVQPHDAGVYICTCQDQHNTNRSRAEIVVTAVSTKPIEVTVEEPKTQSVRVGSTIHFICTAKSKSPAYTLVWTRQGRGNLPDRAVDFNGILTIHNVQPEDAGIYVCTGSNMLAMDEGTAILHVPEPSQTQMFYTAYEMFEGHRLPADGSQPVATVHPPVLSVQQGQRAEFRCTVTGNPPPVIEWIGGPGGRINRNAVIRGEVLSIPAVERADEAEYICKALNVHGEHAARAMLYVHSSSLPQVQVSPQTVDIHEGETLRLYCRAGGTPTPGLDWKRREGPLPQQAIPSHGFHQFKSNSLDVLQKRIEELQARMERTDIGTLLIPNIKASDAGTYLCVGTNSIGSSEASIKVKVIKGEAYDQRHLLNSGQGTADPIPTWITILPQVATVQEGQWLDLSCVVPGNFPASVTWRRTDRPLSSNHQVRGTMLRILQASPDDAGEYICRLEGSSTVQQASVTVTVTSSTSQAITSVTIQPSIATVQEGNLLDLTCIVPGPSSASVVWQRAGRPLSSNHQVRGTMLRILQASPDDAGEYICRLEGSSTVQQASVTVTVTSSTSQAITSVTIQPSIATVQEGNLLDLTCIVPGPSSASVVWQRAGRPLSSNHQVHGSVLRILQASADDAGEYTCRVQGGPAHQQASVTVSVTSSTSRLQTPIISIEPHSTAVRLGEAASFRCYIYSGAQPVHLEWKLAGNQPLPDNVKVGPDNSVITITNAQPRNQGPYHCVASNRFGITRSIASLIVKDSPKVTVTPKSPVRVWVGEPINLECQARGDPRPSVSWHRMDNSHRIVLNSPVPMESNAVMQVLVARPEDSGTYICTAQSSEGTSEARVEVIIEGGAQVPSFPIASVPETFMVVKEGQTVTLHCNAQGYPTPTITWSKLRAPLPWRHSVVNNTLVLTSVGRQDSGQYICNATNNLGVSEVLIMLDVETPPYATTLPDDLSVRVGEVIRLQCLSHGTPPLTFRWTKVNGSMSARAEVRGGNLQINLATANDVGTYKCAVSNKVGSSEALARVIVRSPLEVRVYPQVEVKAPGSAVEFTCSANGGIQTTVEWLKEGGSLPANHHIKDGMLRIENLEKSNAGIYICRATSLYGQAQDTAKLTIQALPKVMINIRTSVQTVMLGSSVEFECHATGDPEPTVQWSKVDGTLFSHVVVKGGMLTINRVTEVDAGKYRCTATNNVGSVQSEVILNVQTLPQITAQPEVREVTVGSTAVFPCMASGYPLPQITWTKLEGPLAPKASQEGHVLTIPNVTFEDSGTYVCTASNKQGKVQAFSMLKVHERIMPYFTQTPLSYLTLPTIKNSYKAFNIKITFRPDNVDGVILYAGMILYNGQKRTTGADFISLGLVGGRPEFRFDVGSGMATIRFPTPIKLGEFHTVELYRNTTQGAIIVDGQAPINGSSQGKFQGLDLNEELHVGGYPNYSIVSKTTGLKNGFVGCIRQLIIQGDEVIFKDLDRSSTGVSNCPTCKDRPCQNGGVCQDSETSNYKCECVRGFTGSNCEHHSSMHCHPEACGSDATCINNPSGRGYDCRCHLGKFGEKCMHGTLVTTPLFNGEDSFITYPPLTNIHNDLRVDLEFKPMEANGLMFFSGGKKMKVEDFVSLAMVDNHIEFRYELGTGMAVLRSRDPVKLGQWHQIEAERIDRDGSLKVDQAREVRRSSPGKAQGLNIYTPMYLGGVPSMDILPKPANISMLFKGCIGEVSINGKKVDLSYSFTESQSISQCVDANPCERRPCRNGGTCLYSAEYEFQCLCQDGFEGELCEVVKDTCQHNSECQNGGRCLANRCVCSSGFTGLFCETRHSLSFPDAMWDLEGSGGNDSPAEYAAYFHDNGYLALPKSVFPRSSLDAPEVIELEIRTASSEGLILWQGVELGDQGKGKDFISLGLQNGHLVFSYQLGSGEAKITSKEPINNADWHMVRAVRTGKQGYIQVDGGPISRGLSRGESVMVNTKGDIYLGGAPNMVALTGGKFSTGITGCIRNLVLANTLPWDRQLQPIDILAHSGEGINVERCSS